MRGRAWSEKEKSGWIGRKSFLPRLVDNVQFYSNWRFLTSYHKQPYNTHKGKFGNGKVIYPEEYLKGGDNDTD